MCTIHTYTLVLSIPGCKPSRLQIRPTSSTASLVIVLFCSAVLVLCCLSKFGSRKSMAMAEAHQGGKQREGWGLDADIVEQALSRVSTQK